MQLLVWIFVMRVMMIITSGVSYLHQRGDRQGALRQRRQDELRGAADLAGLAHLDRSRSSSPTSSRYLLIPDLGGDATLWWKLSTIITCGTLAGAIIPELVKVFTSTESRHVREVVTASREGGASLNILSGLVAGNFSAYWMGIVIVGLMGIAYLDQHACSRRAALMIAPAVFAFGLVAFGFLGMGPVTIAVDSYGPVTDNAQSVFELSTDRDRSRASRQEIKKDFGFDARLRARPSTTSRRTTAPATRSRRPPSRC